MDCTSRIVPNQTLAEYRYYAKSGMLEPSHAALSRSQLTIMHEGCSISSDYVYVRRIPAPISVPYHPTSNVSLHYSQVPAYHQHRTRRLMQIDIIFYYLPDSELACVPVSLVMLVMLGLFVCIILCAHPTVAKMSICINLLVQCWRHLAAVRRGTHTVFAGRRGPLIKHPEL